jgi:fructose-bisphosphate aldolase class I
VPFIKIDKGLEDEANGVQLMKPMPELDALLDARQGAGRLWHQGAFGHQLGQSRGHCRNRGKQQFEVGAQVLAHGMMPMIEPEVNIKSETRAECDADPARRDPEAARRAA